MDISHGRETPVKSPIKKNDSVSNLAQNNTVESKKPAVTTPPRVGQDNSTTGTPNKFDKKCDNKYDVGKSEKHIRSISKSPSPNKKRSASSNDASRSKSPPFAVRAIDSRASRVTTPIKPMGSPYKSKISQPPIKKSENNSSNAAINVTKTKATGSDDVIRPNNAERSFANNSSLANADTEKGGQAPRAHTNALQNFMNLVQSNCYSSSDSSSCDKNERGNREYTLINGRLTQKKTDYYNFNNQILLQTNDFDNVHSKLAFEVDNILNGILV